MTTNIDQIVAQQKWPEFLVLRDAQFQVLRGKPTIRQLPSMGVEVLCFAANTAVSLEKQNGEVIFRYRLETAKGPLADIDAFTFREAFLAVATPAEAFNLLDQAGRFWSTREEPDAVESYLTWGEFQLWQRLIAIVLTDSFLHLGYFHSPDSWPFIWGGAEEEGKIGRPLPDELKQTVWDASETTFNWLQGTPDSWRVISEPAPDDPRKRPKMRAEVWASSVLDAMLASAYIDSLSGVRYEVCALPDCNRVYEVSSNHKREYCTQAHAHKASVRRRRAEAKRKAQEKKQTATKLRSRNKKG